MAGVNSRRHLYLPPGAGDVISPPVNISPHLYTAASGVNDLRDTVSRYMTYVHSSLRCKAMYLIITKRMCAWARRAGAWQNV